MPKIRDMTRSHSSSTSSFYSSSTSLTIKIGAPPGWSPKSWCHLRHADVIFMRWGGDTLGGGSGGGSGGRSNEASVGDRYFCGAGVATGAKSVHGELLIVVHNANCGFQFRSICVSTFTYNLCVLLLNLHLTDN